MKWGEIEVDQDVVLLGKQSDHIVFRLGGVLAQRFEYRKIDGRPS